MRVYLCPKTGLDVLPVILTETEKNYGVDAKDAHITIPS